MALPLDGPTTPGELIIQPTTPKQHWTEWSISQSRASYLAGTIYWWQLEDEIWDALNGRFPKRLGIGPPRDPMIAERR